MEISEAEILKILFDGTKKEIDQLMDRYSIGFKFSREYNQYTIILKNANPPIILRGPITNQIPNCAKYYGFEFNM